MKLIEIKSIKYGTHYAQVDDEDFERVSKLNWSLHVRKKCNDLKYATSLGIYLHRFIFNIRKGEDIKCFVDHKDGNGLNCQKGNMRMCSIGQNQKNRKTPKHSTTGYKGVYLRKEPKYSNRKYTSRIMVNGKRIEIGSFETAELAAIAYNKMASIHHGEFAQLNQLV